MSITTNFHPRSDATIEVEDYSAHGSYACICIRAANGNTLNMWLNDDTYWLLQDKLDSFVPTPKEPKSDV